LKVKVLGPIPDIFSLTSIGQRLAELLENKNPSKTSLSIMVAYADETFRNYLGDVFEKFVKAGGDARVIIGVDSRGTSKKVLQWLLNLLGPGRLYVYHNPGDATFHPKFYLIKIPRKAYVFIGSSNFTSGGMVKNFEINVELELDLRDLNDKKHLTMFENIFKKTVDSRSCLKLDNNILRKLYDAGVLKQRSPKEGETHLTRTARNTLSILFETTKHTYQKSITERISVAKKVFIMSLVNNYVSGKRGDPYFLIPIKARDLNPLFWGWPKDFHRTKAEGVLERHFVAKIKVGRKIVTEQSRLAYYPVRHEFRFKSRTIYKLGTSHYGSFVMISWTKDKSGRSIANIELIPKGTNKFRNLETLSFNTAGSLRKRYIYI
jgi:HKD family nuclease